MQLVCPQHRSVMDLASDGSAYACSSGCQYPVVRGIPRFVPADNYANAFGAQWIAFRRTQLDSYTGVAISHDRLERLLGGDLSILKGKEVLEAGCGAGRFTEVLLQYGARVQALDISLAVEANHENCRNYDNYAVYQASILEPPFPPEQFDVVICVGVIQHTPDPEQTMAVLASMVKLGGLLVVDHYTHGYPVTASRRFLRRLLLNKPSWLTLNFCRLLVALLWPIHRLLWGMCRFINDRIRPPKWASRSGSLETFWVERMQNSGYCWKLYSAWRSFSPAVDYHDAYPQLGNRLLRSWAMLDMHDTLTDVYKHLRSREEIINHLESLDLEVSEAVYGGNGVEARARKPVLNSSLER
jgi:SAM-dependent methyltransferase